MPEEKPTDDVEKFIADQKAFADRKQAIIDDLLRQREAAIGSFDEKLAKVGYRANSSGKPKKSHHRQPAHAAPTVADTPEKPKPKAKA
jgi:hypothetical protein